MLTAHSLLAIPACYLTWSNGLIAGLRGVSLPAVGRALYSLSLHKLSRASSAGLVSRILPLLLQAGCLADNRALHLSSVLYSSGLGVTKHPSKVCVCVCVAGSAAVNLRLWQRCFLSSHALVCGSGLAPGPAGGAAG